MDGLRLSFEGRPPERINDRMSREKESDFFILLRCEERSKTKIWWRSAGTGWKRQIREQATGKGIPQGAPIFHGSHLSARSRPMDRKKERYRKGKWNRLSLR